MPHINTRKLVRIWFSNNPEVFLSPLNQERMIQLRSTNPEAEILLVVNQPFLSPSANEALVQFAQLLQLNVCNFDTFKKELQSEDELALYNLAQMEIQHNLNHMGGNLAAASDLARILFLARGYLYCDFDTEVRLGHLGKTIPLPDTAPSWLTNLYHLCYGDKSEAFLCNDLIVFVSHDEKKIAKTVRYLRNEIINRYNNPLPILSDKLNAKLFMPFLSAHTFNNLFHMRKALEDHYTVDVWQHAMGAPNRSELAKCLRAKIRNRKEVVQWVEKPMYHTDLSDSELIYRWFCWDKEMFLSQLIIAFSGSSSWGEEIKSDLTTPLSTEQMLNAIGQYSLASYGLMDYFHSEQSYGPNYRVTQESLNACLIRSSTKAIRDNSWMSSPLDALRAQTM